MSRSRFRWLLLGLAIGTVPSLRAQDVDPCESGIKGAFLMGRLLDISLTSNELELLNGREDPKLKRHLEWRLISAVAEARRHIDEGAIVERSSAIPNLANGVERASSYITAHDLGSKPPLVEDRYVGHPLENLKVIKEWMSRQP